jgi:hypothetical protein
MRSAVERGAGIVEELRACLAVADLPELAHDFGFARSAPFLTCGLAVSES